MTIGVVILAHHHLHRTKQLAKALASRNVRVVIHVDADTDDTAFGHLQKSVSQNANIALADRVSCDWGTFSLVEAGLAAAEYLLKKWPGVSHVAQISGSCLPIRPIEELTEFLENNVGRDFVESYCAKESNWVIGGLSHERFTLYFPFSWRKQRWLFDRAVEFQRGMRIRRRIPNGLEPHVGSQWWCLCNATLRSILNDPDRSRNDRYFRRCWIPDEGYVPTLVRRHSKDLVPASLTLSRFDDQGKPHMFYDDHGDLLEQSDQFFARKIWHGADGLYRRFLRQNKKKNRKRKIADDLGLDHLFENAHRRRCSGRPGRLTVGRFPAAAHERQPASCRDYTTLLGFSHVFGDLQNWLQSLGSEVVHGRLFQKNAVAFGTVAPDVIGAIPANPKIRDVNPEQFLCNLLWNGRTHHQSMMLEHSDGERIGFFVANDANAIILVLRGSWVLDLLARPESDRRVLRRQARRLRAQEKRFVTELKRNGRDDVIWLELGDMLCNPSRAMATITKATHGLALADGQALPGFRDLSGLRRLIDDLNRAGVKTDMLGNLPETLPGEPLREGSDVVFALG